MVRGKNVLGTIMQSFFILGVISVEWVLWGYSMAFGPDHGGIIGGLDWFGLKGVGMTPSADYGTTIPHVAFMIFQCMFAVITPALITGAFAERVIFSAFLLFTLLWATFVYNPCPLGLGSRRLDGENGGLGFCRRNRSPYQLGDSPWLPLVIGKRLGWRNAHIPTIAYDDHYRSACSGSGGSGSMPGAPWLPTDLAANAFVVTHVAAAMAASFMGFR
jgi:Amt family ammonium transporter